MKPIQPYNSRLEDFTIEFLGMQQERYTFNYYVNKTFLTIFDYPALLECNDFNLHVQLDFTKKSNLFILDFAFLGTINADCDRCLVQADFPVKAQYQVFVKLMGNAPERGDRDLDIIYLNTDETTINVAQLIYEFIALTIPPKRIACIALKDKTICDQTVLAKWKEVNAAEAKSTKKENTEIDPRWAALQKLKDNSQK